MNTELLQTLEKISGLIQGSRDDSDLVVGLRTGVTEKHCSGRDGAMKAQGGFPGPTQLLLLPGTHSAIVLELTRLKVSTAGGVHCA